MSKYGSGVSMKSMMEYEMKNINSILKRSDISEEEQKTILDSFKEVCYQWCMANATACLTEEVMMQMLDVEHRMKMQKMVMRLMISYIPQKMSETYPWYSDDDPEDDPEEDPEEEEEYDD